MTEHYQTHTTTKQRRRKLEGMTLIEIMIVVIIMALIATGATVLILPQITKARIKSSQTDASRISEIATQYIVEMNEGCPTIEELVNNQYLSGNSRTTDAWDNAFEISCDGNEVTVTSAGPDEQFGTEDDIN